MKVDEHEVDFLYVSLYFNTLSEVIKFKRAENKVYFGTIDLKMIQYLGYLDVVNYGR